MTYLVLLYRSLMGEQREGNVKGQSMLSFLFTESHEKRLTRDDGDRHCAVLIVDLARLSFALPSYRRRHEREPEKSTTTSEQ